MCHGRRSGRRPGAYELQTRAPRPRQTRPKGRDNEDDKFANSEDGADEPKYGCPGQRPQWDGDADGSSIGYPLDGFAITYTNELGRLAGDVHELDNAEYTVLDRWDVNNIRVGDVVKDIRAGYVLATPKT